MSQRVRRAGRERTSAVSPAVRRAVRRNLLAWYDRNKRDLPWRRRTDDPYAQWVAEVMLQQTRVDTVAEYYERFLRRFPTIDTLARARHDSVLKLWEGLGYYRRALNLHRAARQLRHERREIPRDFAGLRRLQGIGDYTAAAVASIAFGERRAAVDGNVARVIARLFGIETDVLSSRGKAEVAAVAEELTPRGRPGDFNQAWMDLGTAICTPRVPGCPRCPLRRECVAARTGRTDELPVRDGGRRGRAVPRVALVAAIFVHEGMLFVRRRPQGGLWSGLWEFPSEVHRDGRSVRGLVKSLANSAGLTLHGGSEAAGRVAHRLTHRALTFDVHLAGVVERGETPPHKRWVSQRQIDGLSLSTAHRRILEVARSHLATRRTSRSQ